MSQLQRNKSMASYSSQNSTLSITYLSPLGTLEVISFNDVTPDQLKQIKNILIK